MKVIWSRKALHDLERVTEFLLAYSPELAENVQSMLTDAPDTLLDYPRRGLQLKEFSSQEVRRIIVGDYELRYKLDDDLIIILDIWHGRENR